MSGQGTDLDRTGTLLTRTGERVGSVLRSGVDPYRPVPGLTWSVRDCAVHLVTVAEGFNGYLDGSLTPPHATVRQLAEVNAARIAAEPERDLRVLADRLRAAVDTYVTQANRHGADHPLPWYDGPGLDVASGAGVLLGELLVHGLDLARAACRRWPIGRDAALAATAGALRLLPLYVDRDAAAGLDTRLVLHLRGGPDVGLAFRDGSLEVEDPPGRPVDCYVSADPAAYLLVAYGRRSPWPGILRGRIVAWGRRPWLGLRLPRLFLAP